MSRWPIARYLLGTHTVFLLMILFGLYVATAVVIGVVSFFADITLSGADMLSHALPWAAIGYGASTATLLSTVLVHGRTRREFLLQHPIFQVITTAAIAAMITGVFALETVAYRALGWEQKVQDQRIYSATEYGTIFGAYWSMLLIWLMVGVFFGVLMYRCDAFGLVAIVPAALILITTGGVNGFFSLPFARTDLPLAPVTLVAVALAYAMLWFTARDVPLKTRVA
jgi:magnesium-transporting ATPase (P-type)